MLPWLRVSIIAVMDREGRFLLCHDERRDCDFFPSLPTEGTVVEEGMSLPARLEGTFGLAIGTLEYAGESEGRKPSPSHGGVMRDSTYRLWLAHPTWRRSDAWRADRFMLHGFDCRWAGLADMEGDGDMMRVNGDVIRMVGSAVSALS